MDFFLELLDLRIALALAMLAIASFLDLRKREVHDLLWILFGAASVPLVFLEPELNSALIKTGFSLIIAPVAILLWRFGLFGGADSFSLIVLAVLAPQVTVYGNLVTPFTTLTNALLLSTVILLINVIRNSIAVLSHQDIFQGIEDTKLRKFIAMFLGYRAKNPKHSFSIEKTYGSTKKLDFSLHHAENAEFCTTPNTWVTPGIPFLIYVSVGFIGQIFFGDIIFSMLSPLLM